MDQHLNIGTRGRQALAVPGHTWSCSRVVVVARANRPARCASFFGGAVVCLFVEDGLRVLFARGVFGLRAETNFRQ